MTHADASVERYILALDAADFETVAAILTEATADPALAQLLAEVDEALYAEASLATRQEQKVVVRTLLLQHLPSAFPEHETGPLTIGGVAAWLEAEHAAGRQLLLTGDRSANDALLGNRAALPGRPNQRLSRQVAEATGVQASRHYWERFRQAAVELSMARDQGSIQLAAARRRTPKRQAERPAAIPAASNPDAATPPTPEDA